ncbi:uncharacterized protein METZ01_LOCUS99323 [marine metagenome]|uniref:Uncharacterized protein n=1 Tax=marine metagenome TaxID=408172 RepID=A0A381W1Q4_9ZZZZ
MGDINDMFLMPAARRPWAAEIASSSY